MKTLLIILLLSQNVFAEDLFKIEQPKDTLPIRCEVINTNPDALTYAVGGFLIGTVLWGFFYYQRNKK